jgi:hypothetical protein
LLVEALVEHIEAECYIKFGELANYLQALGIDIDGGEALTGEHLRQPHVQGGTTLLEPVSDVYVQIVEGLFSTKPVMLEIGDPAWFRSGEEPGS